MQTSRSKLVFDCKDFLIPTKKDSRTSETQKLMYSCPNGLFYHVATKDAVTVAIEELNEVQVMPTQENSSTQATPTQSTKSTNFDMRGVTRLNADAKDPKTYLPRAA